MLRKLFSLACTVAVASPAAAVTFITAAGAPDPGKAAGETLLVTFDAPDVAGVSSVNTGSVITSAGSIRGVRAAPAGILSTNVYRSIGSGGSSTFDFSGWTSGRGLKTASFYWGSVDNYNFVDVINSAGAVLRTVSGNNLPQFNGNQTLPITNRRIFFNFLPVEKVTKLRLRSTGNAFEIDNIAATAGVVPEPASWAMLITGFGLIGFAMRRRSAAIAA